MPSFVPSCCLELVYGMLLYVCMYVCMLMYVLFILMWSSSAGCVAKSKIGQSRLTYGAGVRQSRRIFIVKGWRLLRGPVPVFQRGGGPIYIIWVLTFPTEFWVPWLSRMSSDSYEDPAQQGHVLSRAGQPIRNKTIERERTF